MTEQEATYAAIIDTETGETLPEDSTAIVLYQSALALRVVDAVSKETAGNMRISIRNARDVIVNNLKPHKQAAHDKWKRICSIEGERTAPLDNAETYLKNQIKEYDTALMLKRQEEERKARIAAEEAARKEQERILSQAAKAEAAGKNGKAEALLEKAEEVYAAPVAIPAPDKTVHIASGSMTTKTDIEVILPCSDADIKLLCSAIAEGKVPVGVVEFRKQALKQWAKLNQIKGAKYGCVFQEVAGSTIRRK